MRSSQIGECQWLSRLGKRTLLKLSEFKPAHTGRNIYLRMPSFVITAL